jgi:hypothetical protein
VEQQFLAFQPDLLLDEGYQVTVEGVLVVGTLLTVCLNQPLTLVTVHVGVDVGHPRVLFDAAVPKQGVLSCAATSRDGEFQQKHALSKSLLQFLVINCVENPSLWMTSLIAFN